MNTMLKIKLSGSGTKNHIINSLYDLIRSLGDASDETLEAGATFEDPVLCTEVSEDVGGE